MRGSVPSSRRLRHHQDLQGPIVRVPQRQAIGGERSGKKKLPWPILLFLVSLAIPWIFAVGPLSLSISRLILLAMLVPCLAKWIGGAAGRIRAADIALLLFCLWSALSLFVVHGPTFAVQPAGILFVETMGAYLLARCYIRDADDFFNMARMLFRVVAFLFPFALFEALTGRNVLLQLFAAILPSYPDAGEDIRAGLRRVQVVFEHPILFGICAGSALALTHLVLGHRIPPFQRWLKTGLVGATALLSLSSASIAGIVVQAALMMWSGLFRKSPYRWKFLWVPVPGSLSRHRIRLKSDRDPVLHFTLYLRPAYWLASPTDLGVRLCFGPKSSAFWHRIWRLGRDLAGCRQVSTCFGSSIIMRFGIPGGLLMVLSFFAVFLGVSFRKGLDERLVAYRTAYLTMMMAFFLVGWTVHFWGAAYLWFLFLLGSGVWLLDVRIDDGVRIPSGSAPEDRSVGDAR